MSLLVRIELLKLRGTRLSYGLLATAAGLTALFSLLAAVRASSQRVKALPVAPLFTAAGLTTVTTTTSFALLLAAVLGVSLTSGEFRHGTATLTYLGFPNRGRVLAAKAAAAAGVGAIFGCAAGVVATGMGLAFVAATGDPVTLGAGTLLAHVAGAALAAGLLAAVGAALGSLVRGQLGAVVGVFAWGVLESVIGGLFTWVRPYLPYAAATSLGGTKLGEALVGVLRLAPGNGPLPFAASAALVLGAALALSGLAARATVPRDIT